MPPSDPSRTPPFASAEAAWFWAARTIRDGSRAAAAPCRVEEVVRCLDRLYRNRRIELLHARILRIWGNRGVPPNPARAQERSDWQIWREAIDRLEGPLRAKGIVGAPAQPQPAE